MTSVLTGRLDVDAATLHCAFAQKTLVAVATLSHRKHLLLSLRFRTENTCSAARSRADVGRRRYHRCDVFSLRSSMAIHRGSPSLHYVYLRHIFTNVVRDFCEKSNKALNPNRGHLKSEPIRVYSLFRSIQLFFDF